MLILWKSLNRNSINIGLSNQKYLSNIWNAKSDMTFQNWVSAILFWMLAIFCLIPVHSPFNVLTQLLSGVGGRGFFETGKRNRALKHYNISCRNLARKKQLWRTKRGVQQLVGFPYYHWVALFSQRELEACRRLLELQWSNFYSICEGWVIGNSPGNDNACLTR